MREIKFKPRKFIALINEEGIDDIGMSGLTFKVESLRKGKIYEERNPEYLSKPYNHNVVIDDNGCWNHIGEGDFFRKFKEIV